MKQESKEFVYELRAFWRARGENPQECAKRLARMLSGLAGAHPALGSWFGPVDDKVFKEAHDRGLDVRRMDFPREPFCRMPPDVAELAHIIADAVAMKDVPHVPWPELGYYFAASNGKMSGEFSNFLIRAGASSTFNDSINSIDFIFGGPGRGSGDLVAASTLPKLVSTIVSAWCPDWAALGPLDYKPPCWTRENPYARPWGGWMVYLARPWADKVTPPRTVAAEHTPDGGWFMQATDEQFSLDNPTHVARADAIDAAMQPIRW